MKNGLFSFVDFEPAVVRLTSFSVIDHSSFLSPTVFHFRLRLVVGWRAEKRREIEINLINATLGRQPATQNVPTLTVEGDGRRRTVRLPALGR